MILSTSTKRWQSSWRFAKTLAVVAGVPWPEALTGDEKQKTTSLRTSRPLKTWCLHVFEFVRICRTLPLQTCFSFFTHTLFGSVHRVVFFHDIGLLYVITRLQTKLQEQHIYIYIIYIYIYIFLYILFVIVLVNMCWIFDNLCSTNTKWVQEGILRNVTLLLFSLLYSKQTWQRHRWSTMRHPPTHLGAEAPLYEHTTRQ